MHQLPVSACVFARGLARLVALPLALGPLFDAVEHRVLHHLRLAHHLHAFHADVNCHVSRHVRGLRRLGLGGELEIVQGLLADVDLKIRGREGAVVITWLKK